MPDLLKLTAAIVCSFVEKNSVPIDRLDAVIQDVYSALATLDEPAPQEVPLRPKLTPNQIRRSISPDHLVSFEDGKSYVILRRHLTALGMTFAEYKAKWGLPDHYPVAAPEFSAKRSELARKAGLGARRAAPTSASEGGRTRTKRTASRLA